jgi:glucan-binding YG repeat protein
LFYKKLIKLLLFFLVVTGSLLICQTRIKASGETTVGWQQSGTTWYYLNDNGTKITGWLQSGGKWYYLDPNNGTMVTGWIENENKRYYLKSNGEMATGWNCIGSYWYYFNLVNGDMITGWTLSSGKWYYLSPSDGAMVNGWNKINYNWYYLNPNGDMAYNTRINGHYLGKDGSWQRDGEIRWINTGNQWYYLNPMMNHEKGWVCTGGKWYYFNPVSAEMLTGWTLVDGKWYYFYSSGAMAFNTKIDGYFLGSDGVWQSNLPASAYLIKIGSTEKDVLSIMRKPTSENATGFPLYTYNYNRSAIFFLYGEDGPKVIGWWNIDNNLQITAGEKNNYNSTFTLGSSKEDVVGAVGTPSIFDPYYYLFSGRLTYWEYADGSRVDFDENFKVIGWTNKGSLKVNLGEKVTNASAIKLGSTLQDVTAVLGTPVELTFDSRYNSPSTLGYGNTLVNLDKSGLVIGWTNKDSYNFDMGSKDPSAPPIAIGSTLDDIIKAMGTPDDITSSGFNDKPYRVRYGTSYIYLDDMSGKVESWTNTGNLNIAK